MFIPTFRDIKKKLYQHYNIEFNRYTYEYEGKVK